MALMRYTEDGYEYVPEVVERYDLPGLMMLLGVSRETVMGWVMTGELRCCVIGNIRRGNISATREQVENLLSKHPEIMIQDERR